MSEAKHTPGPWRVDPDFRGDIQTEDGRQICSAWSEEDRGLQGKVDGELVADQEADANAALISAAPDLLEALKNLVAIYDDEFGIVAPEMDAARAAIAKAQPSETASGKER